MDKLKIIRAILTNLVERIDNGNCRLSDKEMDDIYESMHRYIDEPLSKYEACRMLGVSRATFDRLVRDGRLPRGTAKAGAHELFWSKCELQRYLDAQDKRN